MKKFNNIIIKLFIKEALTLLLVAALFSGCEKYMNVPIPTGQVAGSGIFETNASAGSVLSGVFTDMISSSYASGSSGIGYTSSLYVDELAGINPANAVLQQFYTNNLTSSSPVPWKDLYTQVYSCNAAIEGLLANSKSLSNKNQYLGEAYFSRAWLFFNAVNIYGDAPMPISTDYKVNNVLSRSPKATLYTQIISDLKNAETLLSAEFHDANGSVTISKARPNKLAAQALLARVYLYQKDWVNAEAESSAVIGSSVLKLTQPAQTFLATSTETIWGLSPLGNGFVTEYGAYNNGMPSTIPTGKTLLSYGPNAVLSNSALAAFETGDARFTNWVRQTYDPASNATYSFPNKYKSNLPGIEMLVVLRLAEQYLIRAEARAMQNNFQNAQADINVIRTRAGLTGTTANDQAGLLTAIAKERRTELFTEFGTRFFDLKRTGAIDGVMSAVAPSKGATWTTDKQLWPLPATEIIVDPNLIQNPGYK